MQTCYPPRFDQAMAFLFSGPDHVISEDLVQLYCRNGLLSEADGRLQMTDRGRAELRRSRRDAVPAASAA